MNSIIKCFSILVASGNGNRCGHLRDVLHHNLISLDEETKKSRIELYKEHGEESDRIGAELYEDVRVLFYDVPSRFFAADLNNV